MHLPLPAKYKHLGVCQSPAGSIRDELIHRIAQARSTFAEAKRKVFRSKAIRLSKKEPDHQLFTGAVWGFYRSLVHDPLAEEQNITAHACFSLLQLPAPATLLRVERLSYLRQMIQAGPPEVWAATRNDRPYAALLLEDLRWLHTWTWATSPLPAPDGQWEIWRSFIAEYPARFKGLLKRTRALTVHQHTVVAALDGLFRTLQHLLAPAADFQSTPQSPCELCLPCKRGFYSRVSWAGHAARLHNYRSRAFLLPQDNICRACGKVFATLGRLRRHLLSAPGCLARWGSFTPDPSTLKVSPHPLAPPTPGIGSFACVPDLAATDGINEALLDSLEKLEGVTEATVWETIEGCIAPLATLRATVQAWQGSLPDSAWVQETAENMLLLLDPTVTAESLQPLPRSCQPAIDEAPVWTSLTSLPLAQSGETLDFQLAAPPAKKMHHSEPTSLTVKEAAAYAAWLEAACHKLAVCATTAMVQPVRLQCQGLGPSLGPAQGWLEACGFRFCEQGTASFGRSFTSIVSPFLNS
ncbi:unnamed protein product [Symbiodinium sp. CCMP2592]|nr:unnamed protein product [Symbiodinium sp. CCMP2592]